VGLHIVSFPAEKPQHSPVRLSDCHLPGKALRVRFICDGSSGGQSNGFLKRTRHFSPFPPEFSGVIFTRISSELRKILLILNYPENAKILKSGDNKGATDLLDSSGCQPYLGSMTPNQITRDPARMGGKPCIRNLRVTVGAITGLLAAGQTRDQILKLYPSLETEDIAAALTYVTWLAEGREVDGVG